MGIEVSLAAVVLAGLWMWFIGWAIALAVIDIREHRLPNAMVGVCLAGTVVWVGALAWAADDVGVALRATLAAVVCVGVFAVGYLIGGMGMGDVKYAAVTGATLSSLGWAAVWWGHLLGFVLAGGVVVIGMLSGKLHRRSAIPFGPFMALGATMIGLAGLVEVITVGARPVLAG